MDLAECREWYSEFTACDENWKDVLDPWIRDLILYLNDLPGCATMCSCAGRGPIGDKPRRNHPPGDIGYVMMKCTNAQMMALIVLAATMEKVEMYVRSGEGNNGPSTETISLYASFRKLKKFEKTVKFLKDKYDSEKEVSVVFGKTRIYDEKGKAISVAFRLSHR